MCMPSAESTGSGAPHGRIQAAPEGRGFDECGRRGILVGTVDKGEADVHFVSFARRKYEIRTVDVTGREALEALETQLPPGGTAADLYRVVFTGETAAGVDLEAVRAVAAERFYHLELRDETRLTRDLWQRAGEESLTGLFLRGLLRRREAAADEAERLRIDRAARFAWPHWKNGNYDYIFFYIKKQKQL